MKEKLELATKTLNMIDKRRLSNSVPLIKDRYPTPMDMVETFGTISYHIEIGTLWINRSVNIVFILKGVSDKGADWEQLTAIWDDVKKEYEVTD